MRHRTTILFANAEAMGQGFQYYTDPNQYCHAALSLSLLPIFIQLEIKAQPLKAYHKCSKENIGCDTDFPWHGRLIHIHVFASYSDGKYLKKIMKFRK